VIFKSFGNFRLINSFFETNKHNKKHNKQLTNKYKQMRQTTPKKLKTKKCFKKGFCLQHI